MQVHFKTTGYSWFFSVDSVPRVNELVVIFKDTYRVAKVIHHVPINQVDVILEVV